MRESTLDTEHLTPDTRLFTLFGVSGSRESWTVDSSCMHHHMGILLHLRCLRNRKNLLPLRPQVLPASARVSVRFAQVRSVSASASQLQGSGSSSSLPHCVIHASVPSLLSLFPVPLSLRLNKRDLPTSTQMPSLFFLLSKSITHLQRNPIRPPSNLTSFPQT